MSGLAGIIDYSGRTERRPVMEKMLTAIIHRGPDNSGIYLSPSACLGSVGMETGSSADSRMPLSGSDGRCRIVFDGVIFNSPELRQKLEKEGYVFKGRSDTELLLNLHNRYGKDCPAMLNGQFAFAIWDSLSGELFMARDRLGIRPLYYCHRNGKFSFASEIKALLMQEDNLAQFSTKGLAQVFTFWAAITPNTVFRDIYELSPGHLLTFSKKGITTERYWELSFSHTSTLSFGDALDRFDELFSDAVRIRLGEEEGVAAFLSGGIDSAATVAYMRQLRPAKLNTFSIGFEDKDFDEKAYQTEAVDFFGTSHVSHSCTADEIAGLFHKVVWHAETALTRTAPAPMMLLSQLAARNGARVVISGEGSDEIMAGYNIFKESEIRRFWARQPESDIRPLLLTRLYPYLPHMKQANPKILKMFFGYSLTDTGNPLYSHLLRWNNSNHIKKHLSAAVKDELGASSVVDSVVEMLPPEFGEWEGLAKAQWLETTIFMSGYLLSSQGDRMAMAGPVQGRYPFLDHRMVEFAASLPPLYKLKGMNEKYLLKRAMAGKIPESILKRPKQAYRAPIRSVFMADHTPEYLRLMFSKEQMEKTGIFDYDSVSALLTKIEKTGSASEVENMLLTAVVSTHLLHSLFMEKNYLSSGILKNTTIIEQS